MLRSSLFAVLEAATMLVGKIFGFLIFTWLLGASAQGAFTLFLTVHTLAIIGSTLGLDTANHYFRSRDSSTWRRSVLTGNTLLFSPILGLVGALIVYEIYVLTDLFREFPSDLVWLLIINVWLGTITLAIGALIYGADRYAVRFAGAFVHNCIFIAGIAFELLFRELSIVGAMTWWTIGAFFCCAYWFISVLKDADGKPHCSIKAARAQFDYAIRAFPYFLLSAYNYRLDNFIIASYWGLRELGIYSVGVAAAELILYLPKSLINSTLTHHAKSSARRIQPILTSLFTILLILIPAACIFGSAAILIFFPPTFAESVYALLLLLPGIAGLAMGNVTVFYLFSKARQLQVLTAAGTGATLTTILNLLFIPQFGIVGAAAASAIAYLAFGLMTLRFAAQADNVSLSDFLRPLPMRAMYRALVEHSNREAK